jgi:hypothetical protein
MAGPDEVDEDPMAAYQRYMMQGASSASPKPSQGTKPAVAIQTPTSYRSPGAQASMPQASRRLFDDESSDKREFFALLVKDLKRADKRLRQFMATFASVMQHEWIHCDDQLQDVFGSILNIRTRLPIEHRMYMEASVGPAEDQRSEFDKMYVPAWERTTGASKGGSFHRLYGYLSEEDLWLALSHDLTQHEKMLAHVRKLLMQISVAHEGLGRHLDNAMQFQFESSALIEAAIDTEAEHITDNNSTEAPMQRVLASVDQTSRIFCMLSKELYRKQLMARSVIDNMEAIVVDGDKLKSHTPEHAGGSKGIKVAAEVNERWSRKSIYSLVNDDEIKGFLAEFLTS